MVIESIDQYISQFDDDVQQRLQTIRQIVAREVPDAVESLSYGLIGYKYHGRPLVYTGGFKHHVGFYATPNGHVAFSDEFSKYKQGKGSVQFPNDQPLPVDLIRRVVLYRKDKEE